MSTETSTSPLDTAALDAAEADATVPTTADVPKGDQVPQGFQFTDHGCRTEIRVGVLLILVAVFLWLWLGPKWCSILFLVGLPMVLIGAPIQAWQARTAGRPGYPLKLGLILTVAGALMWPDMLYREEIGGAASVQPMAPMLLSAGVWMLVWWPVARLGGISQARTAEVTG